VHKIANFFSFVSLQFHDVLVNFMFCLSGVTLSTVYSLCLAVLCLELLQVRLTTFLSITCSVFYVLELRCVI